MKKLIMACLFVGMSCSSFGFDSRGAFFDVFARCMQDRKHRYENYPEKTPLVKKMEAEDRDMCWLVVLGKMDEYQNLQTKKDDGVEAVRNLIEESLTHKGPDLDKLRKFAELYTHYTEVKQKRAGLSKRR